MVDVVGALLGSLAASPATPHPALRAPLNLLLRQVHGGGGYGTGLYGGGAGCTTGAGGAGAAPYSYGVSYGYPYSALCRATAALAAFGGVGAAVGRGGHSPAFGSDLYGPAACQVRGPLGTVLVRVRTRKTRWLCVDAGQLFGRRHRSG